MADYGSHPLWLTDENENLSPEDSRLGLDANLIERISRWAAEFDEILDWDDPASSAFPSTEAEEEFAKAGEMISRQIAKELGPSWTVSYFDLRTETDQVIPYSV
ncbi:hypothetical protein [Streptomyces sp. TRM64462]|uniref:hypothetical protein n=1 Tax=Streptomyces sp. TRM64462 TaxID=2741726 RepID=UPI001586550E|nr:hypothetical protein [Streptomyces sp. TRM64462]